MLLISKIIDIEEGTGRSMSDKKQALSVWAGRWGKYHIIKKNMQEWYQKGVSIDDIEKRVQTGLCQKK